MITITIRTQNISPALKSSFKSLNLSYSLCLISALQQPLLLSLTTVLPLLEFHVIGSIQYIIVCTWLFHLELGYWDWSMLLHMSFPFYCRLVLHGTWFVYPFIGWGTFGFLSIFGYYEQCPHIFVNIYFHFSHMYAYAKVKIARSYNKQITL